MTLFENELPHTSAKDTQIYSNVSFLIKTFERPDALKRLLISIDKFYGYVGKSLSILVADDSKNPLMPDIEMRNNLLYYPLEFDKGTSFGRNYLLDRVNTKYSLILDDDFVFYQKTDVRILFHKMMENPEIDILAGAVHYRNGKKINSNCLFKLAHGNLYRVFTPYKVDNFLNYYDFVVDFFLAKTETIRNIRWNEILKTVEHTAFFLDCYKQEVVIAEYPKVKIYHDKVTNSFYKQFRNNRMMEYLDKFKEIYQLESIIDTKIDRNFRNKLFNNIKILGSVFTYKKQTPFQYMNHVIALRYLTEAVDILKSIHKVAWLTDGTHLGFYREGGFIAHDNDIDLGCWITDYTSEIDKIFIDKGWSLKRTCGRIDCGYEQTWVKSNTRLDIFYFYTEKDTVWHGAWQRDKKTRKRNLIKYTYKPFTLKIVNYKGYDFYVPENQEEYIIQKYGIDWRIPIKDWDWALGPKNAQKTDIWI
jgi:hypothetical protein